MDLALKDRVALVLGSTSGLGLGIGHSLAAEGAKVVFCGRRGNVAKEIAQTSPSAIGLEVDLVDEASRAGLVRQVQESVGQIDILVLNGGGPPPGMASTLTTIEMRQSLDLLLLAQIDFVQHLLPSMRAKGWGRILAIGSSGVQQPIPNLVRSNVARAALAAYLKTLAGEVAADGVTVNMILPGRIDTERVAALDDHKAKREGIDAESVRKASKELIPAHRYGEIKEFAEVATFLCSSRSSYLTGSQIRVDGGAISAL